MKIRTVLICIFASLASGCSWFGFGASPDDAIQATVTGTDQAVQQFLTGRELDTIEGAWEHDENSFEVVISRNDFNVATEYDYVGIITRSDQPSWQHGDIKLLLRSTDASGVFEGVWLTRNKSRRQMTFVVEHRNLVQGSFVSNDGNTYFARIRRMNSRFAAVR